MVWAVDGPGGVLRDPPEGQRRVPGGRAAPGARAQRRPAGRGHRVDGRSRCDELPAPAAPGRGERPRQARHPGLPDESPRLRGHDDRRHLQGPLAGRAVLQGAEAEPEDQDLRGDQCQCPEGPSLDGADRHLAPQVPPTALPLRVVAGELGRPVADEPLYASRAVGLARSAVYRPADRADGLAAGAGPWLIGTAEPGDLMSTPARSRPIAQEIARSTGRIAANLDSSDPNYVVSSSWSRRSKYRRSGSCWLILRAFR